MKYTFKIFVVVMSICNIAYAQTTFNITTNFGVDVASTIFETDSGYFTSISSGQPILPRQAIFCFYDTLGNLNWSKVYGDSNELYNDHSLCKDLNNNFILGTTYYNQLNNHNQLSLRKISSTGDSIWLIHYATDSSSDYYGNWYYLTKDFGFVLPAAVVDSIDANIYVLKTDSAGNFSWEYELLGINNDDAYDAAETINHDYLVVGWTRSFGNGNLNFRDAIVVCIDSTGTYKWKKTFGNSNINELMYRVISSSDGNFLICGAKYIVGQYGNATIWKIDTIGTQLWQRIYSTNSNVSEFHSINELPNGQIVAVGSDRDTSTSLDQGWIVLLDTVGAILKENRFSVGSGHCIFNEVKPTKDGGFIVAGYVLGGPNGQDGWLLKLDSNLCDMPGCSINTSVQEAPNYNNIGDVIIFPNPCTDNLFLKPQFGARIESIAVYDLTGKELKLTINITRELCQINTSELSSGIYIAKMKIENSFKTIKFIKK